MDENDPNEKPVSPFNVVSDAAAAAAAAKSLQSSLTLCDPVDCSLPGSSCHGIFQARVVEWGAIAFSDVVSKATKSLSMNFNPWFPKR